MPMTVASEPSTETWSLQTIAPRDSTAEFPREVSAPSGTGQAYELQKPSSHPHSISPPDPDEVVREAATVEQASDASSVPPDNAAEDMRPTRRYQAVLLLAGFMMIFQVIGINQTYGIFQVGRTCVWIFISIRWAY